MTQSFDPYYKWLGIPPQEQPPSHYRLLGLQAFEADADVIATAVDGRMAQIKRFQAGQYSNQSQRILNEIAVAKVCLLTAEKKADYDASLKDRLEAENKVAPKAAPAVRKARPGMGDGGAASATAADDSDAMPSFTSSLSSSSYSSAARRKSSAPKMGWKIPAMFISGAVIALAVILVLLAKAPGPDDRAVAQNGRGGTAQGDNPGAQPNPNEKVPANTANPTDHPKPPDSPNGGKETKPDQAVSTDTTLSDPHGATPTGTQADYPTLPVDDPDDPDDPDEPGTTPPATAEKPVETPAEVAVVKKPAIPSDDQRKAAEKKVNGIFQKDIAAAKGPKEKLELAVKLADQAKQTQDDPAARYVLLCDARDLAAAAGDLAKAMDYVASIGEVFDADALSLKADLLEDAVRSGRTGQGPDAAQIGEIAAQLTDEAFQSDNFDMAQKFIKVGQATARKLKDTQMVRELTSRENDLKKLKVQFAAVAKAQETLAADPADAEASLTVGRWLCFGKGQWEKGLPLLKKGSDASLAELAARDLESPKDAKQQTALADAWFALGEKDSKGGKKQLEARALKWYEESLPELTGLDKTRVEKRVEGILAGGGALSGHRAVVGRGNVALASNGTTVSCPRGKIIFPENLLDGVTGGNGKKFWWTEGTCPLEWVVLFDKPYVVRQLRILFGREGGNYRYQYKLMVSPDGKVFRPIEPAQQGQSGKWDVIELNSQPVLAVKIVGIFGSVDQFFHVIEFEAYSYPPKKD